MLGTSSSWLRSAKDVPAARKRCREIPLGSCPSGVGRALPGTLEDSPNGTLRCNGLGRRGYMPTARYRDVHRPSRNIAAIVLDSIVSGRQAHPDGQLFRSELRLPCCTI